MVLARPLEQIQPLARKRRPSPTAAPALPEEHFLSSVAPLRVVPVVTNLNTLKTEPGVEEGVKEAELGHLTTLGLEE